MQPCGRWRRQSARIARSLQGVIDSTPLDTTLRDAGRADPRRVLLADQPWPSPSVSLECRLHGATTTPPPPARMQSEFAAWYLVTGGTMPPTQRPCLQWPWHPLISPRSPRVPWLCRPSRRSSHPRHKLAEYSFRPLLTAIGLPVRTNTL